MTSYGYRVGLFQVTETRRKDPLDLSMSLPSGRSLAAYITTALEAMKGVGTSNEKHSTYFSVNEVKTAGWLVRMTGSSGSFGTPARVVDVKTGQTNHSKAIVEDEAVLKDARILAVVPPSRDVFVAAFEVQSNASLISQFYVALDAALSDEGLKLRGEHEVADGIGWSNFLNRPDVGIRGVDLVQRGNHIDGISDPTGVQKLQVSMQIDSKGSKASKLMNALQALRGAAHPPINLGAVFGLSGNFDDQKVVTIQDGHERTINVTQGWPRFVYNISDTLRPSGAEFEDACKDVLEEVLQAQGVARTPGWWGVGPWS